MHTQQSSPEFIIINPCHKPHISQIINIKPHIKYHTYFQSTQLNPNYAQIRYQIHEYNCQSPPQFQVQFTRLLVATFLQFKPKFEGHTLETTSIIHQPRKLRN